MKGGLIVTKWEYKKITLEDMMAYIEKNAKNDKAWFKSVAMDEDGKYNHLKAKREFCERYMPEIIPVAKTSKKKSDLLKNW